MAQDIIATLSGLRPLKIPRTQRSAARNTGLQVENRFAVCRENLKYTSQHWLAVSHNSALPLGSSLKRCEHVSIAHD
jgi:hypothetical protein